jgi:hypothetical protein
MRTRILALWAVVLAAPPFAGAAERALDDFTTGPKVSFLFTGDDTSQQAGTMVGGFRRTHFLVAPFPIAHGGLFHIPAGGPLIVSCGYKVAHRLELIYGVDGSGANAPLNLDLSAYDRLVVDFDGSDAGINFNIVVFWASGAYYSIQGFNLDASNLPFSVTFPFSLFLPTVPGFPVDWSDIDYIVIVAQTGSAIGANDYAIRGFKAVGP